MDNLAKNAMLARQANMTYGKWKALQYQEQQQPKPEPKGDIPEGWKRCEWCGKLFYKKTNGDTGSEERRLLMGSDFLKKIDQAKQECFVAGCELTAQQMFDMMCLVLNDPEIMGKDVFGAARLKKVHDAMYQRERAYHEAWINTQESDYYQEKLDDALRRIFGKIDPFYERYPWMKK